MSHGLGMDRSSGRRVYRRPVLGTSGDVAQSPDINFASVMSTVTYWTFNP